MFDVWCTLLFGWIGYIMKKLKYPLAPLAVALVLGAMTERFFRQSLIMGDGNAMVFFNRTISMWFMIVAMILFAFPAFQAIRAKAKGNSGAKLEDEDVE
jgi:putative tricarboxylic transport membrane protein